jgi:VIT1/CCC1 family predicted Fe2+/Mn2+ transporter
MGTIVSTPEQVAVATEAADHVAAARARARQMLASEGHPVRVDDWRQSFNSARDAVVITWLVWVTLVSAGAAVGAVSNRELGAGLVAAAVGVSLFLGMVRARATASQVRFYEAELQRERYEIQNHREQELEEIRALYAAKGFGPPILDEIVATLSADDDRLLKVMMEEELGLSLEYINHPVMVGLWNGAAALAASLALAVPVYFMPISSGQMWVPVGAAVLLTVIAFAHAGATGRRVVPMLVTWLIMAGVAGAVVHFLAQLLSQR